MITHASRFPSVYTRKFVLQGWCVAVIYRGFAGAFVDAMRFGKLKFFSIGVSFHGCVGFHEYTFARESKKSSFFHFLKLESSLVKRTLQKFPHYPQQSRTSRKKLESSRVIPGKTFPKHEKSRAKPTDKSNVTNKRVKEKSGFVNDAS